MMKMRMSLAASTALVLLAGCEKAEAPAPGDMTTTTEAPVKTAPPVDTATPVDPEADPATAPHRFASWAGKWTGVAGLYVTITPTEPQHYKLEMQSDLATKGTYEGHDSEHDIQFQRGGQERKSIG